MKENTVSSARFINNNVIKIIPSLALVESVASAALEAAAVIIKNKTEIIAMISYGKHNFYVQF